MRRRLQYPLALLSRFLPVLLFTSSHVALAADADSALLRSNAYYNELANYQEQLEDLESRFGPYDRSLLEPLQSLTDLALEQEDHTRVAEFQNRQLQVMRTVLGFRHPELVPLLQDMATTEIRLGNWDSVSDALEHIRYLIADKTQTDTAALLEVIRQQAYWHLARVYLDKIDLRARNFIQARELSSEMVKLAKAEFGKDSIQLIPWLYESALSDYRLVELMNADDPISLDTVDRLVQAEGPARLQLSGGNYIEVGNILGTWKFIPVLEEGELIGEAYLRNAGSAVREIGELAEKYGDLETQAMALIQEGDFQQVMGRRSSIRKYREAREMLLEAGVSSEKVERFFNQPAIIPYPQMFLRLDEALAFQSLGRQGIEALPADKVHLGQFMAWQEGLPDVSMPVSGEEFLNVDLVHHYVDAIVTISSSGKVSPVDVLAASPEEPKVEREALAALRDIRVRPAIINGKATSLRDVQIRYSFLPQD